MVIGKVPKSIVAVNPQELAQKIANEGFKGAVEKAIESSEKDYRAKYKRLLESSRKQQSKGISRFKSSEAETEEFLEQVYQNLPPFFRRMIDDAVGEQSKINKLTQKHKDELRRELANVIDQEIRIKGKFA